MVVRPWMTSPTVALLTETSLPDALRFMEGKNLHHCAVMGSRGFAGTVSRAELYRMLASGGPVGGSTRRCLGDVLIRSPLSVPRDLPIERAAEMMLLNHVFAMPILEDGRLYGMITSSEILRAFTYVMGVCEGGARLVLNSSEGGDLLDEIRQRSCGLTIRSLVACPDPSGGREVVMRVRGRNGASAA